MTTISNDSELKQAVDRLPVDQQRQLGGRFVQDVLYLTKDSRISQAVEVALNQDSQPQEIDDAYRRAKTVAVNTYTACGSDTDWLAQAEHFVAAAAAACLQQSNEADKPSTPAWKAAMQARMAVNCEMIERDQGPSGDESQKQYLLTTQFLAEVAE